MRNNAKCKMQNAKLKVEKQEGEQNEEPRRSFRKA